MEAPAVQEAAYDAHAHALLLAKLQALGVAVPPQLIGEVYQLAEHLLMALPHLQAAPYHEVPTSGPHTFAVALLLKQHCRSFATAPK
jgi:hypothetical protein